MIRTLILLTLLIVMVVIARSHPGVLPEAAQTAGVAVEEQVRKVEQHVQKAVEAAKPHVPDVLAPARKPEPFPAAQAPRAAETQKVKEGKTPPGEPFFMPRGPAGPDLPATPPTPVERDAIPAPKPPPAGVEPHHSLVERDAIPAPKPPKPLFAELPPPTDPLPRSTAAAPPAASPAASAVDRASEARIQALLRDAARILAETELPK